MRSVSKLFIVSAGLLPLAAVAQEVEVIYVERAEARWQSADTTTVPVTTNPDLGDWADYAIFAGVDVASGSISNLQLSVPFDSAPVSLPFEDEGYGVEIPFDDQGTFLTSIGGTYTFSGTGSSAGAFTESVTLDAFSPAISQKLVTNWTALQAFDATQPVVIEFSPLTEAANAEGGFIEVEVSYWDGQETVYVWSSSSIAEEGAFGLDPSTSSVTIPAGLLTGSPFDTYDVIVYYLRIDSIGEPSSFPGALLASATSMELYTQIHPDPQGNGGGGERLYLQAGGWVADDRIGWIYGLTEDWGYSFDFGYVNFAFTPAWYYQSNLGFLYAVSGNFDTGIWMHGPTVGWIYTSAALGGGWYADAFENYDNMINPLD